MNPAPRGRGQRVDGIPAQRRADADHLQYSTSGATVGGRYRPYVSGRRPDDATADVVAASGVQPRAPVRVALIAAAVLVTVTAALGALVGVDDPEESTAATSSTTRLTEPLGARLAVAEKSTSSGETQWITTRDTERSRSRSVESRPLVVPEQGPGEFEVAAAPDQSLPAGSFTYTVEVEQNLAFAADQIARLVDATLTDPRGWSTDTRPLVRVDAAPTIRVLLVTPGTADALCAPLETRGRLSCRNGANVVLNAWRWVNGTPDYTKLLNYRRYVINHEVGHALGFAHQPCPSPGSLAPVMLQQSLGLDGCRPNPWPEPATLTGDPARQRVRAHNRFPMITRWPSQCQDATHKPQCRGVSSRAAQLAPLNATRTTTTPSPYSSAPSAT